MPSYFYNNQIACLSQYMHKDFSSKNMTQSFIKNPQLPPYSPPASTQSFYQPRPSVNSMTYSPDRVNQSLIGPTVGMLHPSFKQYVFSAKQHETLREGSQVQQKENTRMNKQDGQRPSTSFKSIEQRMIEVEKKIDKIEKQEKKGELITKKIQQVMSLQLKDIKYNEELEERLSILEEMMKHLKTTKLDRKQLQSGQFFNTQVLQNEVQQLWKQDEVNKTQLKDNKERLQRLVNKIQTSVLTVGEKYEEFIQSNIIKSIEHVNKLTHHYHEEIEAFKTDYMKLKDKIQGIVSQKEQYKYQVIKQAPPFFKMMQISIPNIKIVQSISILSQRKTQPYNFMTKQTYKEAKSTSSMASYKNNLLNTLYDSIDKSTQSSCTQVLLEKVIYKIDRQYYLLDENDNYLVDGANERVKLTNEHIKVLQENGLIQ